jgi:hypothetical protein
MVEPNGINRRQRRFMTATSGVRHRLCGKEYVRIGPLSIPARPLDAVDYENLDGRPLRFEFQAAPLLQWATSWKHSAGKL